MKCMSTMKIFNTLLFGVILLSGTVSQRASADAVPPAELYSAVQENQDVKLGIEIPEERGQFDRPREIVRIQGDVETTVVSDIVLAEETPASTVPKCGRYDYEPIEVAEFCNTYPTYCHECDGNDATTCIGESCDSCGEKTTTFSPVNVNVMDTFCEAFPAYAVDCDGDGENECCLVCENYLYYDFRDRCVPPGETSYELHDDSQWDEYSMSTVSTFTVTDSGDACLEQGSTDEPVDTESETSMSSDEPPPDTDTVWVSDDSDSARSTDEKDSADEPDSEDNPMFTDSETEGQNAHPKASGGGGCTTAGPLSRRSLLSIVQIILP